MALPPSLRTSITPAELELVASEQLVEIIPLVSMERTAFISVSYWYFVSKEPAPLIEIMSSRANGQMITLRYYCLTLRDETASSPLSLLQPHVGKAPSPNGIGIALHQPSQPSGTSRDDICSGF